MVAYGGWTRYDWGTPEDNRAHYGTDEPPIYSKANYGKWDVPSIWTISDNDKFSFPGDIMDVYDHIDKKDLIKFIPANEYNHLDIVYSKSAAQEVFPIIIDFLKSPVKSKKSNLR